MRDLTTCAREINCINAGAVIVFTRRNENDLYTEDTKREGMEGGERERERLHIVGGYISLLPGASLSILRAFGYPFDVSLFHLLHSAFPRAPVLRFMPLSEIRGTPSKSCQIKSGYSSARARIPAERRVDPPLVLFALFALALSNPREIQMSISNDCHN